MRFIYFLIFISILFSCKQKNNSEKILNENHLTSQIFSININRDTTLFTLSGCIIKIPKGSLQSDDSNVKIEIKESLTITDMVLAGLTTQSNKQPLSSGGMIYFNAVKGYKINFKKSVEILVPTNSYNRDMKIYTAQKNNTNKLNWENPKPLPSDSTTNKIDEGEILFKAVCTQCHKINEEYVGPALYGVTERRPKKWLYDFTRYASEMVFDRSFYVNDSTNFYDPYSLCLKKRYGGIMMTSFPGLSDEDLDKLYAYIKSESDKRPDFKSKSKKNCCDSCELYYNEKSLVNTNKENLIKENGSFFNFDRTISLPLNNVPVDSENYAPITQQVTPYSKVTPVSANAVYYTINISATGWYNIDILLREYSACESSELFVRIKGNYKIDLNVVLIIPSVKAFVEGGKLRNSEQYGFDEDNGRIPLPQNVRSYILAFGEYDNKILFGKAIFNSQVKQVIDVELSEASKEKMTNEIKLFKFDDLKTQIEKSRNAEKIIETNKKIKELDKFKPKDCDCDLEPTPVLASALNSH